MCHQAQRENMDQHQVIPQHMELQEILIQLELPTLLQPERMELAEHMEPVEPVEPVAQVVQVEQVEAAISHIIPEDLDLR